MIIINENLKNGDLISEKNCPNLFSFDFKTNKFLKVREFHCYFDNNFNLIVETTLNNQNEIRKELEHFLKIEKHFLDSQIERMTKKLNKINEMLGV